MSVSKVLYFHFKSKPIEYAFKYEEISSKLTCKISDGASLDVVVPHELEGNIS